jgi:hypothetical protein
MISFRLLFLPDEDAILRECFIASKAFDLSPHNIDTAIIACIEFQHHFAIILFIELFGQRFDDRRLASARRAIEEQVGDIVLVDELFHCMMVIVTGINDVFV